MVKTNWQKHLDKVWNEIKHKKGATYGDAMKKASKTYKGK